jgi:hypothetical protein
MTIDPQACAARPRKKVLMKATLVTIDGLQDVRVTDLTTSGAGVEWDRTIALGEDVLFRRGSVFVAAQVAWSKSKNGGVHFYREVEFPELAPPVRLVFEKVA